MVATFGPWAALAAALAVAGLTSGCKRSVPSSGNCEGAVGHVALGEPIDGQSAYHVDPNDPNAPAVLRLDCSGKLVVRVGLERLPAGGTAPITWNLPSDDPACVAAGPEQKPGCVADPSLHWSIVTPKTRPRVLEGSLELTPGHHGKPLPGTIALRFVDGTEATIRFTLQYGTVPEDDETQVNVGLIPGRITFTGE